MAKHSTTFYGMGLLAILPLFVAIGLAFLLSAMDSFPKPFLVNPTPTPGGGTITTTPTGVQKTATLSLLDKPTTVDSSGLATVRLEIDPGGAQVTAVQVDIGYNAQLINIVQGGVQNGPFFPAPVSNLFRIIDNANGRMSYTWNLSDPTQTAPSTAGTVATFQVRQIRQDGTTSTPLTFQAQTFVTSRGGAGSDILQTKNNTTITLRP